MACLVTVSMTSDLVKGSHWERCLRWGKDTSLFSNQINHLMTLFWCSTSEKTRLQRFHIFKDISLHFSLSRSTVHSTNICLSHVLLNISPVTTKLQKHGNIAAHISWKNCCWAIKVDSFVDQNVPVQYCPTLLVQSVRSKGYIWFEWA